MTCKAVTITGAHESYIVSNVLASRIMAPAASTRLFEGLQEGAAPTWTLLRSGWREEYSMLPALAPLLLNGNTSRPAGLLACSGGSAARQHCTLSRATTGLVFRAAAAQQH